MDYCDVVDVNQVATQLQADITKGVIPAEMVERCITEASLRVDSMIRGSVDVSGLTTLDQVPIVMRQYTAIQTAIYLQDRAAGTDARYNTVWVKALRASLAEHRRTLLDAPLYRADNGEPLPRAVATLVKEKSTGEVAEYCVPTVIRQAVDCDC